MMIETGEGDFSFYNKSFWDLWWQKIFRNFASAKYQWLFFLYVPTIYGMFNYMPGTTTPWITAPVGLGFLGGGFVTLALGRFMANTRLKEIKDESVKIHEQRIQRGDAPTVVMGDNVSPWRDTDNILDTDN